MLIKIFIELWVNKYFFRKKIIFIFYLRNNLKIIFIPSFKKLIGNLFFASLKTSFKVKDYLNDYQAFTTRTIKRPKIFISVSLLAWLVNTSFFFTLNYLCQWIVIVFVVQYKWQVISFKSLNQKFLFQGVLLILLCWYYKVVMNSMDDVSTNNQEGLGL